MRRLGCRVTPVTKTFVVPIAIWPKSIIPTSIPVTPRLKSASSRCRSPTSCCPIRKKGDNSIVARLTPPGRTAHSRRLIATMPRGETGRRYGRTGPQQGGWRAADIDDMFGSMFNGDRQSGGAARRHGRDELYALTTDFLEAVNGATRRLTLPDGRTLDVKIPAGTTDSQVLRLRGQGNKGVNGGADGDALIEIHVTPHRFFKRDGQDIHLELPVTLSEAVLGGPIAVPTPGGSVKMRIPPHSDGGTELRLRGRGVPAHDGKAAGNLYATLRMVVGVPDEALEVFLRDWKPEHPAEPRKTMEAVQ